MEKFTVGFYSMFNRSEWELERKFMEPAGAEAMIANTEEEFVGILGEFDALLVANYNISGENIRKMKKCRVISRQGVGMDNIDIAAAKEMGITVCNVPDCSQQEVGDHTTAMLLSAARNIPFYNQRIKSDKVWDHRSYPPAKSLRETVVFLIGFGKIGQIVADRIAGLFGQIIAYDPHMDEKVFHAKGVTKIGSIDEGLRLADLVSLHLPLVAGSEHMINAEKLSLMKENAYLVNMARGNHVDMDALNEALDKNVIRGAALDVVENEHLPERGDFSHPIFSNPKVFFTPHVGWYGESSNRKARYDAAQDALAVMQGRPPKNRYA
jgi:D-3-phosphoglycerate dehydrogenase